MWNQTSFCATNRSLLEGREGGYSAKKYFEKKMVNTYLHLKLMYECSCNNQHTKINAYLVLEHFLVQFNQRRKDGCRIRRRCIGCYTSLRQAGLPSREAGISAARVHTKCGQCQKTYCLKCFENVHRKSALSDPLA